MSFNGTSSLIRALAFKTATSFCTHHRVLLLDGLTLVHKVFIEPFFGFRHSCDLWLPMTLGAHHWVSTFYTNWLCLLLLDIICAKNPQTLSIASCLKLLERHTLSVSSTRCGQFDQKPPLSENISQPDGLVDSLNFLPNKFKQAGIAP